jgi:hypothetical protein
LNGQKNHMHGGASASPARMPSRWQGRPSGLTFSLRCSSSGRSSSQYLPSLTPPCGRFDPSAATGTGAVWLYRAVPEEPRHGGREVRRPRAPGQASRTCTSRCCSSGMPRPTRAPRASRGSASAPGTCRRARRGRRRRAQTTLKDELTTAVWKPEERISCPRAANPTCPLPTQY